MKAVGKPGMHARAKATVSLVVLSQVVHFLTFSGLALMLPLIREDLGISFVQAGMLSAAATASYALAQIPAGYACDRFGSKRLFFAGLLGWSLLALSLAFAGSFAMAIAILLAGGVCRALLFAPGLALVSSWFPSERRATAMSLFLIGSFIGTIGVALASPGLIGALGWRTTFGLYALLGVATAAAFQRYGAEKTRPAPERRVALAEALQIFRFRLVWVCNALQFIRFAAATAFNFWLPSLLLSDRGLPLTSVGLLIAFTAACAAAANPLGAYVSDRLDNPPLVIGGSLAVLACTSLSIAAVDSLPLLVAVVGAHSVFMTIYFGPLFVVPIEALGKRTAGLATGVGNLFANLGALAAAFMLGWLKDETGSFAAGFQLIAVLCGLGVALSWMLARLRRRALRERAGAAEWAPGAA